jgi:hypothetical protein
MAVRCPLFHINFDTSQAVLHLARRCIKGRKGREEWRSWILERGVVRLAQSLWVATPSQEAGGFSAPPPWLAQHPAEAHHRIRAVFQRGAAWSRPGAKVLGDVPDRLEPKLKHASHGDGQDAADLHYELACKTIAGDASLGVRLIVDRYWMQDGTMPISSYRQQPKQRPYKWRRQD